MKVIYLSGPMSGIEDYNFPEFCRVAMKLRSKGYEVISPAEIEHPDKTWEACMRRDIPELLKADTIALLKGWQESKGAGLEITIAVALEMPIVDAYTLERIYFDIEVNVNEEEVIAP